MALFFVFGRISATQRSSRGFEPRGFSSRDRAVAPQPDWAGFKVLFRDGHEEWFASPLDAHDRMNELDGGAVRTVRESDGATTATPIKFDYRGAWGLRAEPTGDP